MTPSVPKLPVISLCRVVAGDILHNLAAGLCKRAIGKHGGHADDQVAQAAKFSRSAPLSLVATTPPTVARAGHSGSRATIWPWRASSVCIAAHGATGLDGTGHVLPGMFAQAYSCA